MESVQSIRESLILRRNEILDRLGRVESHLRHSDKPLEPDFAEQAVERANDQVLEALDENMRHEILQIDHAINLMEQGKYGVCEFCQKPIAEKRLAALPFTNLCINCAS